MQPKTSETKSNNTTTSATTASPTITSELLSNDVYQIYTYSHESKDGNGDPCNFVSVLTLYNSHNMAVNSNSSCLGTETWMGTYSTSLSKTSIQFTALFDYAGHHDYSGNPPTITINSDGTVSSSMFDAGRGAYIKR